MKNIKRMIGILTALVLTVSGIDMFGKVPSDTNGVRAGSLQPSNPVYDEVSDWTEWSYVYFGEYPQTEVSQEALTDAIIKAPYDGNGDAVVDGVKYRRVNPETATYSTANVSGVFYNWANKTAAYFKYEPIKWRVLQNDGSSLLLLADNVLDCKPYHINDSAVTWSSSYMRNWLNGYEPYTSKGMNFPSIAFTDEEKSAILTSSVGDSDNVLHGTAGGSTTEDKIFLLSIKEVTNGKYGFPSDFMAFSSTRRMKPTGYASAEGVWQATYNEDYDGNCWWLLRSPGSYAKAVSMVYRSGNVYQDGYYTETKYYGVCPAVKINLDSDAWRLAQTEANINHTSSAYAYANSTIKYGNVDSDTEITLEDAREVLKIALAITENVTDSQKTAGDVDGDGGITLSDAQLILKYALGMIDKFPVQNIQPTIDPAPTDTPPSATPEVTSKPTLTPQPTPTQTPVVPTVPPTPEPIVQTHYPASGRVWIAADSIAAEHPKSSYNAQAVYGWGELFADYFNSDFSLNNTAVSGRSTKSFTKESNYKTITSNMQKGDYLLISFGHNDERPAFELYTDPLGKSDVTGSFKWYLKNYYINPAIKAGVTPVLISPVVRRYYMNGQLVKQLHTPYATAMEELKEEYAKQGMTLYYIDLHHKMLNLYQELGEEGTLPLHAMYDKTHFSKDGATRACLDIIEEMKKQDMDICSFLTE